MSFLCPKCRGTVYSTGRCWACPCCGEEGCSLNRLEVEEKEDE